MQCPFCRVMETRVVDSRLAAGGTTVWRRRACDGCQRRFTTYERVEHSLPIVVKKDGQREPFEREIGEAGDKEIASMVIGERVMARLKELDGVAYVRFASVYKSFRDIDEFMAEMDDLLRARGGTGA